MKGAVVLLVSALLGFSAAAQDRLRLTTFPMPTTTASSVPVTSISLSPQTSISVHHSIVRNQPAYPYPYTESPLKSDGSEDSSYYYTYEDISEEASKMVTSTMSTPSTTRTTSKPAVKSFWNSQKAILDQRRKETSQKFKPTYSRPSTPSKDAKPTIEFKSREKPKFGQVNKYKSSYTTSTTKQPTVESFNPGESTSTAKSAKTDFTLNLPINKLSEKEALKDSLKNLNAFTNQIVGRVGEIPVQRNQGSQNQIPLQAQSTIVNSKLDGPAANPQFVENLMKLQKDIQTTQALRNNLQQQAALLTNLKSQPLLNTNQPQNQPKNAQQQPAPNSFTSQLGNAFITATAPIATAGRTAAASTNSQQQSQASSLLQRLGALAASAGGTGGSALSNAIMGRDGGYGGGGNGLTLNLGPVADPLTFFLRLISLIPRPLLDLNGRLFFGIELGKNAGLVSGSGGGAKPGYSG